MKFKTQILKKQYNIDVSKIIKNALKEDIPHKDITSELLIPKNSISTAVIKAKQDGIVCGVDIVKKCFNLIDKKTKIKINKQDGQWVKKGDLILELKGKTKYILEVERTALNFLQHLSGIASYTNKMVKLAEKYDVTILDTRKTIPGLRYLAKYAVTIGGGKNHRLNLSDEILIKENHILVNKDVKNTLIKLRKKYHKNFEIEVENLEEFNQAIQYKAPYILLDNFKISDIKKAVKLNNGQAKLEVSGGVNLKNIKKIVKTGIDFISIGSITHSAPAMDYSLIIK